MTGLFSCRFACRLAALLGLALIFVSARGADSSRVWGGGEKGWAGWTATGGWRQLDWPRAGDPNPGQKHWESQEPTTGTLRSPVMTVSEDYLQFWVNGWDGEGGGKGLSRYTLCRAGDGQVLREFRAPQFDGFTEGNWIVSDLKGQQVYFEAADRVAGNAYAWLGLARVDGVSLDLTGPGGSPYRALTPPALFKKAELSYAERGGIPFLYINKPSIFEQDKTVRLGVGGKARRLFLLGMTTTPDQGVFFWSDPKNYSLMFFLGDRVGTIRLVYADGKTENYPLIMGENVWWGRRFFDNPEPFASEPASQKVLERTLRLYPAQPMQDGRYLAVIEPRPVAIRTIELEDAPGKTGVPTLAAVTAEVEQGQTLPESDPLPAPAQAADLKRFLKKMPLRHDVKEARIQKGLEDLRNVLYTTTANFPKHDPLNIPANYQGPKVEFKGDRYADVLTNMFYHNVQDMRDKVDGEGVYHTSTKDAPTWGGNQGFGSFKKKLGTYYEQYWSRDMSRSMQELEALGILAEPRRNAEWAMKMAQVWTQGDPKLKLNGKVDLPAHWCRTLNMPDLNTGWPLSGCFENDGHGLTILHLYHLWRHMPDGNAWARAHWDDIQAAGEWILWQFAHPELSRATDVLWTDSECAGGVGHTVYADCVCMEALRGLAEMADAVGKPIQAKRWRARAELMKAGIEHNYIYLDPKYGKTWTLESAGWPNRSTPLGPLMFLADRRGLAPEDDDTNWRAINKATYQRLVDTFQPFGFYGVAMGYGQGFVSQAALLLDRMQDATTMMQWAAKETYNAHYKPYIVPEGSAEDPTGNYIFRTSDIGNGVQEAEIVKSMRLIVGVDDLQPDRLRIFPRMPYGWTQMSIERYPALIGRPGAVSQALLRYTLRRERRGGMSFELAADKPLPGAELRLGPFAKAPEADGLIVDGQPTPAHIEKSGDSFWVRLMIPEGTKRMTVKAAVEAGPCWPW